MKNERLKVADDFILWDCHDFIYIKYMYRSITVALKCVMFNCVFMAIKK